MTTTPLYIFDLDGTIANIEHRRHMVERPACTFCGWVKKCDHDKHLLVQMQNHYQPYGERPRFEADWQAFYTACDLDEPNDPVIQVMEKLRDGFPARHADIWFFSGRSDEVRAKTEAWLVEHTSFKLWELDTCLMMRPAGDHTADDELKEKWLNSMLDVDRKRLVAVFDDRDRVVAMWRRNGVPCFQVAPGEF